MNKLVSTLEINKIILELSKYAKTPLGKEKIENLKVLRNRKNILAELNKLKEYMGLASNFGNVPVFSNLDFNNIFKQIKKGYVLNEINLNDLRNEINTINEIQRFIKKKDISFNYLSEIFDFDDVDNILNEINRCITSNNEVSSNASVRLKEIRKKLSSIEKKTKVILDECLNKYKSIMSLDTVSYKNGHYAFPINTNKKSLIKGFLLDISDSGKTSFIEPIELVEIENERFNLQLEEKEEINKILSSITRLIYEKRDSILKNNINMSLIDFYQTKASYAFDINGVIPEISSNQIIELYQARHPLMNKDDLVPNDFILKGNKKLFLISGPNAGGKTVALKTVSILIAMNQMGLAIPALSNSILGIFDNIYIELGDNQSLEANLSTFSAHISNLARIFKKITNKDIIFIDELCTGTDPREGESLSIAIVKFLLNKSCLGFITSHYENLKKFGLSNKQILSASFLFDKENIKPTFKLLTGISGRSYGFLISKKFGLKESIINDARSIYNDKSSRVDEQITEIENKNDELRQKEIELLQKIEILKQKETELITKEEKLSTKETKLKERKLDELDQYIESIQEEINLIYNEFLQEKNLKKAEIQLEHLIEKETDNIQINDYVKVLDTNIEGVVKAINKDKYTITTNEGLSINTTLSKLKLLNNKPKTTYKLVNIDNDLLGRKQTARTLNLIGFRVEEAKNSIDYFLSEAYAAGIKEVKIIHGYGTGKLRIGVHAHLKQQRLVESFKLGDDTSSGTGVTVVKLK